MKRDAYVCEFGLQFLDARFVLHRPLLSIDRVQEAAVAGQCVGDGLVQQILRARGLERRLQQQWILTYRF
jgi:hypothetical protein